jgi:hypothetical protein
VEGVRARAQPALTQTVDTFLFRSDDCAAVEGSGS